MYVKKNWVFLGGGMEGKKEERVWEAGKPSNETDVHVQVYLKKIKKKYFFLFIKKKKNFGAVLVEQIFFLLP